MDRLAGQKEVAKRHRRQHPSRLFSRRVVTVALLLAFQAAFPIVGLYVLSDYFIYINTVLRIVSIAVAVYIFNRPGNPEYKLAWVIPILIFPLFGGLFYILYRLQASIKHLRLRMLAILEATQPLLEQNPETMERLRKENHGAQSQANYLFQDAGYPVYDNTTTEYLSTGEIKFARLKDELSKARHYIFLEYFIIQEGIMWNSVLEILEEKVKKGVDVRLLFDGMGCLTTLPADYERELRKKGIQCKVFNPFVPVLSTVYNNRDHRKIAVIDGHTAFTGGINLADEYINAYVKYGHWKDSSILVKGEGVWSFTMLFLQMWYCDDPAALCALPRSEFDQYRPSYYHPQEFDSDGLVQPYGDSPMDNQRVGENVYLNLIYGAKDYLYITTPYLIMDSELRYALCVAAKRGVDVRFITPFVPDKALVHMTTRSGYQELVEAGIRIYEYTPGFIHSKTVVCDEQVATVGTINFDFRSLYLHFECGVWMYRTKAMKQVKADFLETLQSCREITLEDCKRVPVYRRLFWSVLRLFSPLM